MYVATNKDRYPGRIVDIDYEAQTARVILYQWPLDKTGYFRLWDTDNEDGVWWYKFHEEIRSILPDPDVVSKASTRRRKVYQFPCLLTYLPERE